LREIIQKLIMTKLRSAVIGCGKIAQVHAQALMNIEETELVAVQSRNAEKAAATAAKFGVAAHTDIADMIKKERVDVVVICTPHPAHKEPAITAMQAGAHVMIEKPLAVTLSDCDEMIQVAAQTGKNLGMVSQRRFYPSCRRIKEAIDNGKLGTPMLGTVVMYGWRDEKYYSSDPWRGKWKEEGGGVLVNQAPHQLDLLLWYMGSEPEELYGVWQNINHPYIEVEDTATAIIRFKNGAVGNIVVSNAQKPGIYGKVHIHGSNGASAGVQTDGGAMFIAGQSTILEPPLNDIWTIPGEEAFVKEWHATDTEQFNAVDPVEYYMRLQNRDFILAVIENRQPLVTAREGRKTVALFDALYRSMREGKAVKW
jgi:UDP-N-acetyl-2-amino-2-deoxyglucuronate dehydrogenase